MNKTTVESDLWTTVFVGGEADVLVQFIDPVIWATGEMPTENFGFTGQPFEKVVVPAGVSVFARSNGTATATILTGTFGAVP